MHCVHRTLIDLKNLILNMGFFARVLMRAIYINVIEQNKGKKIEKIIVKKYSSYQLVNNYLQLQKKENFLPFRLKKILPEIQFFPEILILSY